MARGGSTSETPHQEWGPLLPGYSSLAEPALAFNPVRPDDRHLHPLAGLLEFGPYSRSLFVAVQDPIRVAIVAPNGESGVVTNLLSELGSHHRPTERRNYLPDFPGAGAVLSTRVVPADGPSTHELSPHIDSDMSEGLPHEVLTSALVRALRTLRGHRSSFDVVCIYLPGRWSDGFVGNAGEDFDLHDHLKAAASTLGMPIQVVTDEALTYGCRASVAWRLSIAFYVKAGGVPWVIADAERETAYVGISYSLRSQADRRFVICCSQIFDDDGTGLEFLAYDIDAERLDARNPFLDRRDMRRVIGRTLALYQHRHGGRSPRRVIVHKATRFTDAEVDGAFDALPTVEDLELVQIQDDTPWLGVQIEERPGHTKGRPSGYPCRRGLLQPLARDAVLVWTQGNAPDAVGGRNYFKEGKGVPRPVLLRRFSGTRGWDETARRVLALTKMNWNNDGLYDRLPTTMRYASVLARIAKMADIVPGHSYAFRYVM